MRILIVIVAIFISGTPIFAQRTENNAPPGTAILEHIAGTYKGRLFCANCASIETTLVLQLASDTTHGTHGQYQLTNKYLSTRHGDSVLTTKGSWFANTYTYKNKKVELPSYIYNTIVLEGKDPGSSTYYGLEKDRDLIPIYFDNGTIKSPDAPFDLAMKKQ